MNLYTTARLNEPPRIGSIWTDDGGNSHVTVYLDGRGHQRFESSSVDELLAAADVCQRAAESLRREQLRVHRLAVSS